MGFSTLFDGISLSMIVPVTDKIMTNKQIVIPTELPLFLNNFIQKINKKEVGSSTMPHKVNPIDFENAEGNLQIANSLAVSISNKLPISRLQRDLSDSTVKRNLGLVFGYSLLAGNSLIKGLKKLKPNKALLKKELHLFYIFYYFLVLLNLNNAS